jgi:transcriptional regulator with XRE-family HTH domain
VLDIKQRIITIREVLGIKKQSGFVENLGINRTTLIGYENETSPPSVEFLIRLRKIYKVNFEWLLMEMVLCSYPKRIIRM